jgi:hypothetical protein
MLVSRKPIAEYAIGLLETAIERSKARAVELSANCANPNTAEARVPMLGEDSAIRKSPAAAPGYGEPVDDQRRPAPDRINVVSALPARE